MFKAGDTITFYDPLKGKRVIAKVQVNRGPGPAGGKADRIYVSNPGGVSMVWPDMKPKLVKEA